MTDRLDPRIEAWPLRPWLTAILCALAGWLFHLLTGQVAARPIPAVQQAAATFVAVATLSFVVTVERARALWAAVFALSWGLVTAFVGWSTASYNHVGSITEIPFLASLFALLVAAPLFQTVRDEAAWRLPYGRFESHAWADAVILGVSVMFTGVTFALAFLVASLFDLIGLSLLRRLLEKGWFVLSLAGLAFGGAFGLLRERGSLVTAPRRFVTTVLCILAPALAVALLLFLLSTPFTGLSGLWKAWISAAVLLLTASAGAVLLANAVMGDRQEDRPASALLHGSALVLVLVVLPLSVLAGVAIGLRVVQYGWTPDRLWGAVVVGAAVVYGVIGWWSAARGGWNFDMRIRPLQARLAVGVCGAALFLAMPIVDFGAIATRSQLARMESEKMTPDAFDWAALAFDFGPAGRRQLGELARTGPAPWRERAAAALQANDRRILADQARTAAQAENVAQRIRALSAGMVLTPDLIARVARSHLCTPGAQCGLIRLDENRLVLLVTDGERRRVQPHVIDLQQKADEKAIAPAPVAGVDLDRAQVEVRSVMRRQVYVDGKPVGAALE